MIPEDHRACENDRARGDRAPWADLIHPLPLGAAALLFTNDHLLKGSGLLPGAVTGKLSDFAGLFVFPVLVVGSLRWALARARWPLPGRWTSMLVWGAAAITGALFAAIKLVPAVNHLACAVLGQNSMDATDLVALPALVASGLWMTRRAAADSVASSGPADAVAPRRLHGIAVILVALACAATSAQKPPVQPEPQPVRAVPRRLGCAAVTPVTCRYDATRYAVRLSAQKLAEGACAVRVGQVYSVPQIGNNMPVAETPMVDLGDRDAALFGAWGRIVLLPGTATGGGAGAAAGGGAAAATEQKKVRVLVQQQGSDPDGPMSDDSLLEMACRPGFTGDTEPPAQVAQ